MILKSFKYTTPDWKLDRLILDRENLIVGKNSSGKSKSLQALLQVKALISQYKEINIDDSFETELIFQDDDNKISFCLKVSDNIITKEVLSFNGDDIIKRTDKKARIDGELVNPPAEMLLMQVRRDTTKYPVIEKVIKWAENAIIQSFIQDNLLSQRRLYEVVCSLTSEMKLHVVEMANKVGFPLKQIDTFGNMYHTPVQGSGGSKFDEIKLVLFEEKDVKPILFGSNLSNGMYRTIMLFILIEQMIGTKQPALIAIDDLGEGLDYTRATKVGKLLFDICKEHNIQLLATSNEEFMMNVIDINHWNILVRKGSTVKSINASDYPGEFKEFKYSGLDNFDFFTSDFLNRISNNLFIRK